MIQLNPNFIRHIESELPPHLSLTDFIDYCNKPLRKSIRVNTLKISTTKFVEIMTQAGWTLSAIPWCDDGFWIEGNDDIQLGNAIEHIQGLFYIQEASSMLPPTALFAHNNQPEVVLDVASAPGSKTTQIAALMNNNGLLVANEYSASRVKVLHANISRMGASHTAITHFDGRVFGEYLFESFDAILLDAPCGGEGTVRKDPLALKNWDIADVTAIAETQKDLIESAFLALKPGGSLVYSTCTLSQIENQQICHHLQHTYPDAVEFVSLNHLFTGADKACTEEGFLHVWPQLFDSEGFFVAKIRKTTSVERNTKVPKLQKNFPFSIAGQKQQTELRSYFKDTFSIELPQDDIIMIRDDEYWLFPSLFMDFIGKMRFQRIGLKLADAMKKGFKAKHEAIIALTSTTHTHRTIELVASQAQDFLMGRDIDTQSFDDISQQALAIMPQGEMLVSYHGAVLGVVKHLGHRLKNNLPRDLVRDKVNLSL
ncbi:16S rRNA (cytosine(1407)-C(5))-methyltransferase RsmF [Shewanella inventionis]|uniref:Ribosomal RNA small subunit methyltransferase F n=1 Tax=Shewanella inventionis TaxID=1738770 RepID=A0ABQ1IR52_9GAMM|nr:16S rRNA (cytosine(1407)-C(5))-methyltransferase RsmF [Shewanella inventionis]MCL1157177.1 16S rRNA (cytosine(1407)-C(5))-methyltransferase RsmF [Shewanella inventionis]UAL41963.1 16S rRNA (cytosine(1407)-C(5))-methyltransferase RsmF [Shewanella inventionis]GGB49238.1 ribosomal RNA small subunit methyltransferase F [Shewanella inventionis]